MPKNVDRNFEWLILNANIFERRIKFCQSQKGKEEESVET